MNTEITWSKWMRMLSGNYQNLSKPILALKCKGHCKYFTKRPIPQCTRTAVEGKKACQCMVRVVNWISDYTTIDFTLGIADHTRSPMGRKMLKYAETSIYIFCLLFYSLGFGWWDPFMMSQHCKSAKKPSHFWWILVTLMFYAHLEIASNI